MKDECKETTALAEPGEYYQLTPNITAHFCTTGIHSIRPHLLTSTYLPGSLHIQGFVPCAMFHSCVVRLPVNEARNLSIHILR